jgi:hypothetical protein
MGRTLSAFDEKRYAACRELVADALRKQFDAGLALIEINEKKYYEKDFGTFEEFVRTTYNMARSTAYQMMSAAQVVALLPETAAKHITSESQALALESIPEKERPKVVQQIVKSGENITAKKVKEYSQMSVATDTKETEKTGKSNGEPARKNEKPPVELDKEGTPIPDDALPFWHRSQEIQDILTQITRLKSIVQKGKENGDPMFSKVSNAVIDSFASCYSHLQEALPYAVCTTCMGSFSVQPKGCSFCGNKGMISKHQWNTQSREEIKEMRKKANARRHD